MRRFFLLLLPLALAISSPCAAPLKLPPFGNGLPRAGGAALDSALGRTWEGIKQRNVEAFTTGMVHRPKSEAPGDAVSEGQSYGMLVAVMMDDQAAFDQIWYATEKNLLSGDGDFYNWRMLPDGTLETGAASDADQDIALSLLFADSLVRKGRWAAGHKSPKGATYRQRAEKLLATLWNDMVADGKYLKPGQWGGAGLLNPGYFSPASYRIFQQLDPGKRNWMAVVDQSYATLFANPGAGKGLLPDWSDGQGQTLPTGPGYNAYAKGAWMYKDAIRVHWRIAMDWLWFGEPRARRWLDSAMKFIQEPTNADFFRLDGQKLPPADVFVINLPGGDTLHRPRREHSHMTVGMWGCAAAGAPSAETWAAELLEFHDPATNFWGHASDPAQEDTAHNEMYFDQFLAWFGGAVIAGRFSNILDDLADPDPGVLLAWSQPPAADRRELDFAEGPMRLSGRLSKAASWTVSVASLDSSRTWSASGRSDVLDAAWSGTDMDGRPFPQGWTRVVVNVRGLDSFGLWVWVAHHRDLVVEDKWLLIDDFEDGDVVPYFGAFGSFDNGYLGGTASVTGPSAATEGADKVLKWNYGLGENGYQFCGLEWKPAGWTGLRAVNTIRYRARAAHKTVVDLYFVQTDVGGDDYYHILDTLTTTWKTTEAPLSKFTKRMSGTAGAPDLSKVTGLRWHVQADKCPAGETCVTGSVEIDDFRAAGDMAAMYARPAAYKAISGEPPAGVAPTQRLETARLVVRRLDGRIQLRVPDGTTELSLVDARGRVLMRRAAPAAGWTAVERAAGIAFVVARGPWGTTSAILPP